MAKKIIWSDNQIKEIVDYYQSDLYVRLQDVADRYSVSVKTIRGVLEGQGIKIRVGTRPGEKRRPYKNGVARTEALTPEVIRLYVEEGLTLYKVAQEVRISEDRARKILRENNITIKMSAHRMSAEDKRAIGQAISASKTGIARSAESIAKQKATVADKKENFWESRDCVLRGNGCVGSGSFECYKTSQQMFCSVPCHTVSQATGTFSACVECGTNTGSHNRRYCDEHRPATGRKAGATKTGACIVDGCQVVWTRPINYPSKMLYCPEHANNGHSLSRMKRFDLGGGVLAEGGYEVRFLGCCYRLGVDFEPFSRDDVLTFVDGEGISRSYGPDFILKTRTGKPMFVEIKGYQRALQAMAYPEFRAKIGKLAVIRLKDLELLESLKSGDDFIDEILALTFVS